MRKNPSLDAALWGLDPRTQADPLALFREGEPARERVLQAFARTMADIVMVFNDPDSPYRQGMARNELAVENLRLELGEISWTRDHVDNQARFASPLTHAPHMVQVILGTARRAEGCFVFGSRKGRATRDFARVSADSVLPGLASEEASSVEPVALLVVKERTKVGGKARRAMRLFAVHVKGLAEDGKTLYYHDLVDLGEIGPAAQPRSSAPLPDPVPVRPTLGDARRPRRDPSDGVGD